MFVIVDYTELYFQSHLFSDGIRSRGILEPLIKFLFVLFVQPLPNFFTCQDRFLIKQQSSYCPNNLVLGKCL